MEYGFAGSLQAKVAAINVFQFKTTQLLFTMVHDVQRGRTRAIFLDCWLETDEASGSETSSSTQKVRASAKKTSGD